MRLTFVFVHGLSGWGSYDKSYRLLPYWGMRNGDLITALRKDGYDCYAASVAPKGSAWDRACELYAQLAGTLTDYGQAHSARCGHPRFGRDFSGCPLIPSFDADTRLVLLGHSFGGATVRVLAELLAHGDTAEREQTDRDLSALFRGTLGGRVHSLVALASPMNGTTAYELSGSESVPADAPFWSAPLGRMTEAGTKIKRSGRVEYDYADFDMHIDNALALNRRLPTLPDVYYFSVPCSCTREENGRQVPLTERMEPHFVRSSYRIGCFTGRTRGGELLDASWQENDGLVNTVSARFPFGAPSKALDKAQIPPGVWNVFPTFAGDHMSLQGGILRKRDIRPFYRELLELISRLPDEKAS